MIVSGAQMELDFIPYEQVPLCNYTMNYTVTLIERESPDLRSQPLDPAIERQSFGDPKLVTIDLEQRKILIDADDRSLMDKSYQVTINCHVGVDERVQRPYSGYMPPFDITVVAKIEKVFVPPNTGPILDNFEG